VLYGRQRTQAKSRIEANILDADTARHPAARVETSEGPQAAHAVDAGEDRESEYLRDSPDDPASDPWDASSHLRQ
jgi:hypothetical protein